MRPEHSTHTERTRTGLGETRAQILLSCIWVVLVTTVIAFVGILIIGPGVPITLMLGSFASFFVVYGLSLYLLKRTHSDAAAWIFVLGTLTLQIVTNLFNEGLEGQAIVSFLNVILIAGFTLSRNAALVTTAIAALSVAFYSILRDKGLLPSSPFYPDVKIQTLAISVTMLASGGIVSFALVHVNRALYREREARDEVQNSMNSLAVALEENQQRTTLSEHLVHLGQRLLETRTHSDQIRELVSACMKVEGITAVQVLNVHGELLRTEGHRSSPPGDSDMEFSVRIPGPAFFQTLSMAGTRLPGAAGAYRHYLSSAAGLFAEAAARVTAETYVQNAQKMEAIGRLSAGVAHDFNNLLTSIHGGVELAQMQSTKGLSDAAQLETIQAATVRAIALTQKMMAFNPSGHRDNLSVELMHVLKSIEPVLQQSIPPEIQLILPEDPGPVWVQGDRLELEQIFLNLVHNARDAISNTGCIEIEVNPGTNTSEPVQVVVSDDGRGMTPEVLAHLYDPFFTTRSDEGGHGLGLTSVYALLEQLGGRINVNSKPGQGARFTLQLPRPVPHSSAASTENHAPQGSPEPETGLPNLRSRRVLLVEDNHQVREVVELMLAETYLQVEAVESGRDALRHLTESPDFDLLITDVLMPNMDGHQLASQIRADGLTIPVILISGFSPKFDGDEVQLQPFRRLSKPFTQAQLTRVIQSILSEADPPSSTQC